MYPLWQMRQGLSFDDSAASKGCREVEVKEWQKLYRMRTLCGRLPYRCSRTFRISCREGTRIRLLRLPGTCSDDAVV